MTIIKKDMNDTPIWFQEPSVFRRLGRSDWRANVRLASALDVRACERGSSISHVNICQLPESWQPKLYQDFMKKDWDDVLLELFVGRTLQLLGGSISIEEPIEATGKRPDFAATFVDGSVTVRGHSGKSQYSLT